MAQHVTIYIAQHLDDQSDEVAMEEARRGEKALEAVGFKIVGGAYASDGHAASVAMSFVMALGDGDDDA